MKPELGSADSVIFVSAIAYDGNGNVIKCDKCANQASSFITSIGYSVNLCEEHSFFGGELSSRFIYVPQGNRKPTVDGEDSDKFSFASVPYILDDSWINDLRSHIAGIRLVRVRLCKCRRKTSLIKCLRSCRKGYYRSIN